MTKKKADYGKGKTPGAFCVLPQRAVIDPRFKTYPRTFMILACLGNYTSRTGVCWPNQITIAKNLHITQSTVSKHIQKLIEWGYIRYAKKHPGLKGNKYFMVFDPKVKEEDAKAIATVNDRSFEEKITIPKGPLMNKNSNGKYSSRVNNKKDTNKVDIPSSEYVDIPSERLHNTPSNNISILNSSRLIMNSYVKFCREIFGQHKVYDFKQEELVKSWLNKGLHPDTAIAKIRTTIQWRKDNRYDCPGTIYFFKPIFFKEDKGNDTRLDIQKMIKKLANKKRMPWK